MMQTQTKMKISKQGQYAEVLVLVKHPMDTEQHKDNQSKQSTPANYLQSMTFLLNDKEVARAYFGPHVSKDPMTGVIPNDYMPGDVVKVKWVDSSGYHGGGEAIVK